MGRDHRHACNWSRSSRSKRFSPTTANDYHLGAHGSFQIYGFGEAAEAFFGKDLSQIDLPEAAALAGMIQRPSAFDPYRHPDRLKDRRNIVLGLMRQNGYISDRDYALALQAPVTVARGSAQSTEAPYFVDLVGEELQSKFQDTDFRSNASRIYTTLDMRLQRAAADAIRAGMQNVDEQIRKQRRFRGQTPPEPQVALIAIDPHTGAVRALAGGRNYGVSQLNHVLAQRQPGSIFKPFVYATAMDTAHRRRFAHSHAQHHRQRNPDDLLLRERNKGVRAQELR